MPVDEWDWVTPKTTQAKVDDGTLALPLACVQDLDGSWGVRDRNGWWLAGWSAKQMTRKEKDNAILLCHVKYKIPIKEKAK